MGLLLQDAVAESGLPRRLKPIAMRYARYADDSDGGNCFVSASRIANDLSCGISIVRRYRHELVRMGVLKADVRVVEGRRRVLVRSFVAAALPRAAQRERELTLRGARATRATTHGDGRATRSTTRCTSTSESTSKSTSTWVRERVANREERARETRPRSLPSSIAGVGYSTDTPCPICGGEVSNLRFKPFEGTEPKCNRCYYWSKEAPITAANLANARRASTPRVTEIVPANVGVLTATDSEAEDE